MSRRATQRRRTVFQPAFHTWPDAGVYQLHIRVPCAVELVIGGLGRCHFRAGLYVYTGRAARGLRLRVRRHLRSDKQLRWHIDYLLAGAGCRVTRIVLASSDPEDECPVNQALAPAGMAVAGFGASDCRSRCGAHLVLLRTL